MESSDTPQNEIDGRQFQRRVGNRSEYYARQVAEAEAHLEITRAYDRSRFWFAVRASLGCICTTGAGLLIMGWGMHTTNVEHGRLAWALGPIVGNTLTLILIGCAWMKWEKDDW